MSEQTRNEKVVIEKEEAKQKRKIPKLAIIIPIIILILILVGLIIGLVVSSNNKQQVEIQDTYNTTTDLLDFIADDIYSCWYDAIYNKKYFGNINTALLVSENNTKAKREEVEVNNSKLSDIVSELNNGNYKKKHADTFNAIMDAYDAYKEYYEFTINVSGSFKSYSQDKEKLKKEVRSYLSKLERKL